MGRLRQWFLGEDLPDFEREYEWVGEARETTPPPSLAPPVRRPKASPAPVERAALVAETPAARPADQDKVQLSRGALAALIFAFVMPMIGFMMGLALMASGDRDGWRATVVSVGVFFLYLVLVLALGW